MRGFSHIAQPLNNLTKKDFPWTWGSTQQNTFDTLHNFLHNQITSEPVLIQPQLDKQFELEVDSSGFAQGAVLMQKCNYCKQHPVGFYSKTLTEPECNYDICDLEFSAIVHALLNWKHLLAGSPHDIIVHTDQDTNHACQLTMVATTPKD